MNLTHENYFSPESMAYYMSQSQFKQFDDCEAKAYAILNGEIDDDKECFIEGRYFEAIICGKRAEFEAEYKQLLISSRGRTKGDPKSNYLDVVQAAEAFMRQPAFQEIVARCEQQVILTGVMRAFRSKRRLTSSTARRFPSGTRSACATLSGFITSANSITRRGTLVAAITIRRQSSAN